MQPEIGTIYRHFKGRYYDIIGVGKHSETLEEFVIYRARYEDENFKKGDLWIRPLHFFLEIITRDGRTEARFMKVETAPESGKDE